MKRTASEPDPDLPLWGRIGYSAALLGSVGNSIPALLLFAVSTRTSSRFFAAALLAALFALFWWAVSKRFLWRLPAMSIAVPAIALAVCLYALAVWCSPTGQVSGRSCLTSVYKRPASINRFSLTWIVDERDQVRFGGLFLPYLGRSIGGNQARQFARTFDAAYADLNRSPDFVQVGSVLGYAYADMLLGSPSPRHAYVYHPSSRQGRQCPVIVFLHGWLGNMKPYIWNWTGFAEENGFVIVCPTFGNGLWKGRQADETLAWLDGLLRTDPMCDPEQVFVVGLSNGGTGVVRWAQTLPHTFRGLVMLSPVMDGTDSPEFADAVGSRPILVLHGGRDDQIPPDYVKAAVTAMRQKGLHVQSISYPDEDHIMILSSRERMQSDLLAWIGSERHGRHGQ